MAQVIDEQKSETVGGMSFSRVDPQFEDFNYRPIPVLAPVSLFLAVISAAALLWDLATVVPLAAVVVSLIAAMQISRADGALGGRWMARTAVVLSSVLLIGCVTLHSYNFATEVPEGYERLSFLNDISKVALETKNGVTTLTDEVRELDGEKVFLKGYMYPTGQMKDIRQFVLCKDLDECCFGGTPKVTDMIMVNLKDGPGVKYLERQLVAVAGTFRLNPGAVSTGGIRPVFELEGTHFTRAKTSY